MVDGTTSTGKWDANELRKFGLSTGAISAGLFGLLLPWAFDHRLPWWPWVLFGVLSAWALIAPVSLHPVYRAWMKFGAVINRVTSPLILGIVFFLVIMPVGLVRRAFGRDSLARQFDAELSTYRVNTENRKKEDLEHLY